MAKKGMQVHYEHKNHKAYVEELQGKVKSGHKKATTTFYYTSPDGHHYTKEVHLED